MFSLDTEYYRYDGAGKIESTPSGTFRDILKPIEEGKVTLIEGVVIKGDGENHLLKIVTREGKYCAFFVDTCLYNSSGNTWRKLNKFLSELTF